MFSNYFAYVVHCNSITSVFNFKDIFIYFCSLGHAWCQIQILKQIPLI